MNYYLSSLKFVIINGKEEVFTELEDFNDLKIDSVDLLEQKPGKLLPINPPLVLQKNQTLVFDVSDPSLSYSRNNILYPAFSLEFYTDKELKNRFLSTKKPINSMLLLLE